MTLKKPLLITFEGGEGAGKSTLIESFYQKLLEMGYSIIKTREPGGSLLGEQVRHLLLHQNKYAIGNIAEILLFLTSRAQQIEEVIKPHLEKGYIVLCDRFNESTIAYQGIARGIGKEYTQNLCHLACRELTPNLTFILDLDPKLGLQRTQKMGKQWDRLEQLDLSFHKKVREAYQTLAKENPSRIKLIDASQPSAAVFDECFNVFLKQCGW